MLEKTLLEKMASESDKTVIVRIPFDMQVQSLIDVLQIGVKNDLKFVIATKAN
jgi:biopolymer transport protein ExbD